MVSPQMKVAVLGGSRIPFCRSGTTYAELSNKQLMTKALKGLVNKFDLKDKYIGEVCLGAVVKHSSDFSLARETAIDAGLSYATPGLDLQRACGTSLEAAVVVAQKIATGQINAGIAGGTDTSSEVPIELKPGLSTTLVKLSRARSLKDRLLTLGDLTPKAIGLEFPAVKEPRTGLSMGEHCELMAKEWQISRERQDDLAAASHHKASLAYEKGFYNDLVVPFKGNRADNNVRPNPDRSKLSNLKPAFDGSSGQGTLTAGNSSPLTDGAACVLLSDEAWAQEQGLDVESYLTYAQTAAVNFEGDEGLLMAPAYAVPKMLQRAGLTLQDFDFYEIHEAFAAQVLCTMDAWRSASFCRDKLGLDQPLGVIDESKLNVMGGSIALGHPFAATGARIIATMSKLLKQKGSGRGLISICTAGGMGVCAIMER